MFGKVSGWISVSLLATALAMGGTAEANSLSRVSTRIIPNFDNSGSDVCFVRNSNNVPVSAVISVFPIGTAITGIDDWTFPIVLSAFGVARVFSWTPPRHAGSCKVLSVQ